MTIIQRIIINYLRQLVFYMGIQSNTPYKQRGICPSLQSPNIHAGMDTWLIVHGNKSGEGGF